MAATGGGEPSGMRPGSGVDAVRGGACRPSCAVASVTACSASSRAVVYLTPISVMAPSTPSCRCSRRMGRSASPNDPPMPPAGTTPRWTSVMSSGDSCSDGNASLTSRRNAWHSSGATMWASAPHGEGPCHVPIDRRPCHGSANSRRPLRVAAPQAMAGAWRRVTRFIALIRRGGLRTPKAAISRPPAAPVALSTTREPIDSAAPSTWSRADTPTTLRPCMIGSIAST